MAFAHWTDGETNWISGEPLTHSDLNDTADEAMSPIGSIVGLAKNLTGVPSLLSGWVECNGQTISDADSPLNGTTLPNLNASGGGTQRFLRGATTSGGTGGADSHYHAWPLGAVTPQPTGSISWHSASTLNTSTNSHLPPYYEVVWCMRIK